MSALSLAQYLRERTSELKLSNSDVAKRANISRQTWYRLLNSDVEQAKLTTFVRVASALSTHPMHLIQLYFHDSTFYPCKSLKSDGSKFMSGFVSDVNYPNNSSVYAGETFTKVWRIINLEKNTWKDRYLLCLDKYQEDSRINDFLLQPQSRIIPLPETPSGETIDIAVTFKAPSFAGTVISEWAASDSDENIIENSSFGVLRCLVKVVSI